MKFQIKIKTNGFDMNNKHRINPVNFNMGQNSTCTGIIEY